MRAALDGAPELAAGWQSLAWVLERSGNPGSAATALAAGRRLASAAPRGFPYGVGNGFHTNGQRFLMVVGSEGLALYRPARARGGARP